MEGQVKVMEREQSDRKSRLAELAKAIKAKKTDISKSLEKVNSEVKRSLAVQETAVRRTRTVLEEVARQEHEETVQTQEVEETRGKSGVIRRRVKGSTETTASKSIAPAKSPEAPSAAPSAAVGASPAAVPPETVVTGVVPSVGSVPATALDAKRSVPVAAPRASTPEADEVRPAARRRSTAAEPTPTVERTADQEPGTPVAEPAVAPVAPPATAAEKADAPSHAGASPQGAASPPATEATPAPMAAAPVREEPAAASASTVALIKRAGRDVTPAGLTFTPDQPRPVAPVRGRETPGIGAEAPARGVAVPGTERRAGKQIFELKEMTFGPGQLHGGRRKRVIPKKQQQKTQITTPKAIKRKIDIEGAVTVGSLAQRMAVKVGDVMKKLMSMGVMATVNQQIDADTATLVASEFGYEVSNVEFKEDEALGLEAKEDEAQLELRAPVVTIMGHVDHGKTSLLDTIRKTDVAAGEAGGITQHIGAYQIEVDGKRITFLDTPGHEAFTAMRARGAEVTDIVVLVCAVDDGPQPQTIEAINHAKAAEVPIIVALNKADKPGTDPDKVMQKLTEHGLVPEEWGGDTMFVKTSAKTKLGIKELLESILLRAEVEELKANPNKPAVGAIVEAKIDKGRGPVATVLVQEGTLKVGDAIVSGPYFGKVRAISDDKGKSLKEAGPSTPVEVLGLSGVPEAGDSLHVAADIDAAKSVAEHRSAKAREQVVTVARKPTMDSMFGGEKTAKELNVIVKADVQGSVQALSHALEKLSSEKVKVKVVAGSVGAISESDVLLATASKAMIVGFNVKPDNRGREMAEQEHVDVRPYSIIYEALDDVRQIMIGMLDPIFKETPLGKAEVRNLFQSSKVGTVAGCMVVEGKVSRKAKARVLRQGKVVFDGKIGSLRRFKDDASEVAEGFECGLSVDGFADVQVGDEIACYVVEQLAATL